MESSINLQRCDDVWFDDGTVILRAEDTLFRVYKGMLTTHCHFFRALFQEPITGSLYEGSPVVVLQDTTAKAARQFLLFLHGDRAPLKGRIQDTPTALELLHMSTKYGADRLAADIWDAGIREALELYFPTTLEGLRRFQSLNKRAFELIPDVMKAAMFFSTHAPQHLPAALLRLTEYTLREGPGENKLHRLEQFSDTVQFSRFLMLKVQRGRQQLSIRAHKDVYSLPSLSCASPTAVQCKAAKYDIRAQAEDNDGCIYPFDMATLQTSQATASSTLCATCTQGFIQDSERALEAIWSDLPNIFELAAGWDVLLPLQNATTPGSRL